MADTVLLTGITGFLGGHLALELLQAGYHVRGSLRNPARADTVRDALWQAGADISRLEFVRLDLLDDAGWEDAATGARFVMHAASPFVTSMPKDRMELIRPAVAGTERAVGAAKAAGVERVVLTSSSVAITQGSEVPRKDRLGPGDWSDPDGPRANAYAASKVLAELSAWALVRGGGPELAVINPGMILGPLLDDDPGTSGALIRRFLNGEIPVSPRLWMHIVDVRDLARIHVAALTDPEAAGRRHPAAFGTLSLTEMAEALARQFPDYRRRMPKITAPDWFVRLYALFDKDARGALADLGFEAHIASDEAARLLGRAPRPAEEALEAMGASLIARGLVKPPRARKTAGRAALPTRHA